MRTSLSLLGLLIICLNLRGQDCSCLSQFHFVKDYYEKNNPAFQKIKANDTSYKNYCKEVEKLTTEIGQEESTDRCNIYFERYVALLRDHHSSIDLNLQRLPIDFNSQQNIDSFKASARYKLFKKIKIDTAQLILQFESRPAQDIEGLYTNGSTTVALMKTAPGTYTGVVVKETKLLEVGHVLFEFTKRTDGTFDCIFHTGLLGVNFQNVYKSVAIKNGQIPELGFSKINVQSIAASRPYSFSELDSLTNYIRLSSFSGNLKQELDSFYQAIDPLIQSKPYLLIDLRDNGGGAEACYFNLVKYFYTKPLHVDNIEVWVSPDNIKRYEEAGWSATLIKRMKEATPFTFIPQLEEAGGNWTMDGTKYPEKVVVLYNRITGSAAEGMITYAIQSDKVITMGENSGGYIGYGDVMKANIPCGKYSLRSTTTKYYNNSRYEFEGIKPMVALSEKADWIEAAKRTLEKQD